MSLCPGSLEPSRSKLLVTVCPRKVSGSASKVVSVFPPTGGLGGGSNF